MSKELAFTDDNDVVKYLDTTTAFNLALTADGVAFDLTNAKSILVKIANDDGYIMQQTIDLTTVTSPLGGTLSFPINQDIMNTLVPDDYDIEVWVTMNDGTQAIFPSDGTLGFSIEENLMSDTGEVIPVITLNDFKQQFDDLSSQMENAVHNVQKGDKGDKGDTGTGLEIKDKVSSVSNLPSTANEGDGYLVGEELYVWVNGAWKDCGPLQGPKGDQGIQGNTGTGVSSTTIQYQISNSATTAPTGTWSNNIVATTTTNPYLWMKATLNYTDDTTKDFYLVSQKGDKGDTGATGATGPIGPQGPVGAGLVVKGTVNDASQLPTTGNQEGYCYFVGTDLYVWDAGTWKNCGSVSPDLSKYVTVTDLNNGLSTKVTDNKDGTEQLNGVKVQPFNKLSDTIGGRNLLINTAQLNDWKVCLDETSNISDTYLGLNIYQTNAHYGGERIFWSYLAPKLKANTNYVMSEYVRNTSPTTSANIGMFENDANTGNPSGIVYNKYGFSKTLPPNSGWTRISVIINIASFPTNTIGKLRFENCTNLTDGYVQFAGLKFEQGSVATDWTPAPEDKVNVSDMRKPANDVAGIEEVNAKQDKLTITPADDSKVAHLSGANNFDTVPTVKNNPLLLASSFPSDLARTGSDQEFTGKNTFDTAPIDKTTGHPYITKDSVPAVPDTLADTTKDANFTGKLQKSGIDAATTTDVNNTINTAVSPLNTNTNWTSLNVDSSQTENSDWEPSTTNLQYRIYNSTLYLTGQYIMLGNGGNSSHNSTTLFQLSSDITSKISFPSTNKFPIGILQALAQQASMFMISLTSDGKITCVTNPYDLNVTYGASMAGGFINAAIPLNL
ncbi:hypothetical protein [Lentilactobacillus farraginis]|uniref:Phage capsid and scaffold n=1 Tax=Lentilactobacillus farraginis DSM 18382 = JCM 14108 TaxID=1423743 RepID=X0QGT2_9LACO|nr:hypothetical protein [Lentilactobacillus farraginis]KRM10326.1 hypothetical protein FD41_GL002123 [Lentilactobacillus farraginis DSM 18382 = JCM 14108]GAF37830.1 phage capsid and scaffold [Lentilactobacillus farraginis DSM 18382 = JCM 14108]